MSAESSKAASVRQRLLDRTHAEAEGYQSLLTRYVLERFLHRLGESARLGAEMVEGVDRRWAWAVRQRRTISSGPS